MSVVTVEQLETYLGTTNDGTYQSVLDQAESLVATQGMGVESFAKRTDLEQKLRLKRSGEYLELVEGPLAGNITDLSVEGEETPRDAADLFGTHWWWMRDLTVWPADRTITVKSDVGWNAADLPAPVRDAVLAQAAKIITNKTGAQRSGFRLGDYSETFAVPSGETGLLSPDAKALVKEYRRPDWY